jgi:hypothetical protein
MDEAWTLSEQAPPTSTKTHLLSHPITHTGNTGDHLLDLFARHEA